MHVNGTSVLDPSLDIASGLCLSVEQATAALASLTNRFVSHADQRAATSDRVWRELAAVVIEHGMTAVREATDDLPNWANENDDDRAFVAWCREQATTLLACEVAR